MKMYIRIRKEKNMIILESIHKTEDHKNLVNWGVINMLSEKQLKTLSEEQIKINIDEMKQKKELWIKQGLCEEYPY